MGEETFTARFKQEWARSGLNATDLGSAIGVTAGQIYDYDKGSIPSATRLAAMAQTFGCSMDYLWGLTDVREPRRAEAPESAGETARASGPRMVTVPRRPPANDEAQDVALEPKTGTATPGARRGRRSA